MSRHLKPFEVLHDLGPEELEALDELLEEREYDEERTIFSHEEEADELFLIRSGGVRVELAGQVLGELGTGQTLGAACLVLIGKRECDAIAQGTTQLLVLTREGYHRLRLDAPRAALALQEGILRTFAGLAREVSNERRGAPRVDVA